MIGLVSESVDFPTSEVMVVKSLREVLTLSGISTVVIHTPAELHSDDSFELPNRIDQLRGKRVIYVRSGDHVDERLRAFVEGIQGSYIADEFYLEDESTLLGMVHSGQEIVSATLEGDYNILKSFSEKIEKGEDIKPMFSRLVTQSTGKVLEQYRSALNEVSRISEQSLKTLVEVGTISAEQKKIIDDLKAEQEFFKAELESSSPVSSFGGVMIYPTVSYTGSDNLVLLKDLGYAPYTISFAMALSEYLRMNLYKKPRLILVGGTDFAIESRIPESVPRISTTTPPTHESVVFTSQPTSALMTTLMTDRNFDSYVVLDLTNNRPSHIVRRAGHPTVYLVRSRSVLSKFKINPKLVVGSISEIPNSLGTILVLSPYPTNISSRVSAYHDKMGTVIRNTLKISKIKR